MSDNQQNNLIKNISSEKISFTKGSWIRLGIAAVILITLFVIWHSLQVILAIFGGVLLAVLLHWLSVVVSSYIPLPRRGALFIVIGVLALLIILLGYYGIPYLTDQFTQLGQQLQDSWSTVRSQLSESTLGQFILNQIPNPQESNNGSGPITNNLYSRVSSVFSTSFDLITNGIIILFVGIYLAYEPKLYINGLVKLAPFKYRSRLRYMFSEIVFSLRWWLLGQFVGMIIIGILATAGLMIIGIPLELPLGILAGLLEFVPILGSITTSFGPILVGLAISPQTALYVILLFLSIQLLEGNVITPIIQKKAVRLPPVLLLASQVVLGLFAGIIGVAVAAPLAVVGMIVVKMLYVEDILNDHSVEYLSERRSKNKQERALAQVQE